MFPEIQCADCCGATFNGKVAVYKAVNVEHAPQLYMLSHVM